MRDALVELEVEELPDGVEAWALPVVAETWDGTLNDVDGFHVTAEHAKAAYRAATAGSGRRGLGRRRHRDDLPRVQGRHRHRVTAGGDDWTVGVLVQANYGRR